MQEPTPLVIGPPTIQDLPDAEINHFVRETDKLFLNPFGTVNLLLMFDTIPAKEQRLYIEVSREQRRRKRVAKA